MSSPLNPNARVIALAGDWHGNLVFALAQVERAHKAGAQVIVHLGDFGFWIPGRETKRFLVRLEAKLAELELHLVFVDGNHEDHSRLAARKINPETGLRTIQSHIHHLPRGFRWQWAGHTWMGLGGAVSVDKHHRRVGHDWWPEEVLSDADVARAIDGGPVDVLVSHDAPDGVYIPGLRPQDFPKDVIAEADAHRRVMRTVVDALRPRHLWHGHYHVRYGDRLDLGWDADRPDWSGECSVQGLDCDQGGWADNIALVGPDGALHRS